MRLDERLKAYGQSDMYGFHMPGHKRNVEKFGSLLPYDCDITEIEGFDDLHHPADLLLDVQERASKLFHSEQSYMLVNGSTAGNLAAIMACTNYGDQILVARNNHRSVYHALELNGLKATYIYPKFDEKTLILGEIEARDVEQALEEEREIRAVVIVSPTYDGVISDVGAIAEVAHRYGVPLIVDEAHGSHLGFHANLFHNSNECGADIVVHSLHKTLTSLTQTALLHVNGKLVDRRRVEKYLQVFQSSSPSYLLMASIDRCVGQLEEAKTFLFWEYMGQLDHLRSKLSKLKHLKLIEMENMEPSKILISTRNTNISSRELYKVLLERFQLQMEMVGYEYVLGMTSIGDTEEGMNRLANALLEIDSEITSAVNEDDMLPLLKAIAGGKKKTDAQMSGNGCFYYLYPPGIPFVTPDEAVTEEIEVLMKQYEENGFVIHKQV